jgi:transcriptional regulator with XRE-family HTH domain
MVTSMSRFAERFAILVDEFGSRYRLSKAARVPESTLQQYSRREGVGVLPPRADILMKLARAANVSAEWLATGKGEMRPAGLVPGAELADVVMIELRDPRAALEMEQIIANLPFSRSWLQSRLCIRDADPLMLIEADHQLPPTIKRGDLLLVDRTMAKKLPRREGIYILSGAVGLTLRRVRVRLNGRFVLSGPDISEEVEASDLARRVVGQVVWRGGRI